MIILSFTDERGGFSMNLLTENEIQDLGIHQVSYIDAKEIKYYQWVRDLCEENKCGHFNKNWSCPPAHGSVEECEKICSKYDNAMVFTGKYKLRREVDYRSMVKAYGEFRELTENLDKNLSNKLEDYKVFSIGSCKVCEKCSYPDPCRFPERLYPAVEAMGINVSELTKLAKVNYAEENLTIIYIGMVLF